MMSALVVDGVFHHVTSSSTVLDLPQGSSGIHLLALQDGGSRNTHEDIIMFTNRNQWEISIGVLDVKEKSQSLYQ